MAFSSFERDWKAVMRTFPAHFILRETSPYYFSPRIHRPKMRNPGHSQGFALGKSDLSEIGRPSCAHFQRISSFAKHHHTISAPASIVQKCETPAIARASHLVSPI